MMMISVWNALIKCFSAYCNLGYKNLLTMY
jgi:hypothetical protein